MINLIKMDFYRMVRSKMTWIILIFAMCFAYFSMSRVKTESLEYKDFKDIYGSRGDGILANPGFTLATPVTEDGSEPDLMAFVEVDMESGIHIILIAIFASMFIDSERKNGYGKNIGRLHEQKSKPVISKMITVVVYLGVLLLAYSAVQIICGMYFYKQAALGLSGRVLRCILTQYLYMSAFAVLVIFVTTLFRSGELGLVIGILLAIGMGYLVTRRISGVIFGPFFDLERFFIVGIINRLRSDFHEPDLLFVFARGVAWFALWSGLTIWITEKRDII